MNFFRLAHVIFLGLNGHPGSRTAVVPSAYWHAKLKYRFVLSAKTSRQGRSHPSGAKKGSTEPTELGTRQPGAAKCGSIMVTLTADESGDGLVEPPLPKAETEEPVGRGAGTDGDAAAAAAVSDCTAAAAAAHTDELEGASSSAATQGTAASGRSRRLSKMSDAVKQLSDRIAHSLVIQSDRSTPHDALVYLGQSMAFAAACSVFPCYAAWCAGTFSHEVGTGYFGEDAEGEPAVYRECCLPTESLYQESHHIEHLAAAPVEPYDAVEFGATPSSSSMPPLWRSGYLVYVLGSAIPPVFIFGTLFRFRLTTKAVVGYAAFALWLIVAWTDALTKLYAHNFKHGTIEGGEELRATVYGMAFLGFLVPHVLPVFASTRPMSMTVKCKAAGAMFLWIIVNAILISFLYQNVITEIFFGTESMVYKVLIRIVGHIVFKKVYLEVSWQFVFYLYKIGAVEGSKRAYLLHTAGLVYLTMWGRMMQTTSSNIGLTVVLELFAVVAEVFEARDLLRLDTPLQKNVKTVAYLGRTLSRSLSTASVISVTEEDGSGGRPGASTAARGVEAEVNFDEADLRHEFCARVLITTQLVEAVSIVVTTALLFAMPPISFGAAGTPPISSSVLWGNFAVMLVGEVILSDALVAHLSRSGWMRGAKVDLPLAWKTQDKVATAALFAVLAFVPAIVLTTAPTRLCFTSSERFDGGDWVLPDFDDFMLSSCPLPGLTNPPGLYPNATAGHW